MCGIFGGISFNGDYFPGKEALADGSEFLKHRGPDDEGELFLETRLSKVSFAHRRLSIIDLTETGHQPMASESGETTIVFNGEIYNYRLLKSELINIGCSFRSTSDTEVILNAYERWGMERTLHKLDGMFAMALFDKRSDTLWLARDRFGKKPLYYYCGDKHLVFGSDIRSFGKLRNISLSIDLHSLGYFFSELSTPHERTIWREIKKIKPGHYMQFGEKGILAYKPYWGLSYTEDCKLSRADIIEKTEFLLSNAVKKRLVADVRVSALLSGGIDSSLIVANMSRHSSGKVKTYSVGFSEDSFNELPYARQVAQRFDTDHTELVISARNLENMNGLILEYGEPFADASMLPTYLMLKEISRNEKVVLGGDGGDELFAGYHSYYFANKFDRVKRYGFALPAAEMLQNIFNTYRTDLLKRLLEASRFPRYTLLNRNFGFSETDLANLLSDDAFAKALTVEHEYIWNTYSPNSSNDLINVLSASLKTRLLNDYLVKVDRASMYASVEMRTPFLDKDLAEFASTLNPDQLFHSSGTKSILKEVAEKSFTREFVHRNKMGFGVPMGEWFKNDLSHVLRRVVIEERQSLVDLNYVFIERIIEEHLSGAADHTHKLWALYVFHIWSNNQ